jgi:hypothetical protein
MATEGMTRMTIKQIYWLCLLQMTLCIGCDRQTAIEQVRDEREHVSKAILDISTNTAVQRRQ